MWGKEHQLSFSECERSFVKKPTRRETFLAEMEAVVPFSVLLSLIEPFYSLSDEAVENDLIDIVCIRRFAGIDLATDGIPDATTILAFRHFLEKHHLGEKIFQAVREHLREKGLLLRQGTVVDATIIHAPTSTRNQKKERDSEMHQRRKGNQWFFGMKAHVGVDKNSGLIDSVSTPGANVHDVTVAAELLHGEERLVYGNAEYQVLQTREEMAGQDVECRIAMRSGQRRRLDQTPEGQLLHWMERAKAHIRAKVEHPFRVMEQQFGFQKTRLPGMAKNHCKVMVLADLTNGAYVPQCRTRLKAVSATV